MYMDDGHSLVRSGTLETCKSMVSVHLRACLSAIVAMLFTLSGLTNSRSIGMMINGTFHNGNLGLL